MIGKAVCQPMSKVLADANLRVSGFRVSGFPGFRVSGFPGFRVSGFANFAHEHEVARAA
jgi:hypothetical protein